MLNIVKNKNDNIVYDVYYHNKLVGRVLYINNVTNPPEYVAEYWNPNNTNLNELYNKHTHKVYKGTTLYEIEEWYRKIVIIHILE